MSLTMLIKYSVSIVQTLSRIIWYISIFSCVLPNFSKQLQKSAWCLPLSDILTKTFPRLINNVHNTIRQCHNTTKSSQAGHQDGSPVPCPNVMLTNQLQILCNKKNLPGPLYNTACPNNRLLYKSSHNQNLKQDFDKTLDEAAISALIHTNNHEEIF